jgi:predicted GTPase
MRDLKSTIDRTDCDTVVIATPIDLGRVIEIGKPSTRVGYSLQEIGSPNMEDVLDSFIKKIKAGGG